MNRAKLAIKQRYREKYGTYYMMLWKIIDQRWDNQLHWDIHAGTGLFWNLMYCYFRIQCVTKYDINNLITSCIILLESKVLL